METFKNLLDSNHVVMIRDVEAAISSTASASASTPIASVSTNEKRENDR